MYMALKPLPEARHVMPPPLPEGPARTQQMDHRQRLYHHHLFKRKKG